jgi:hypothetical protein
MPISSSLRTSGRSAAGTYERPSSSAAIPSPFRRCPPAANDVRLLPSKTSSVAGRVTVAPPERSTAAVHTACGTATYAGFGLGSAAATAAPPPNA